MVGVPDLLACNFEKTGVSASGRIAFPARQRNKAIKSNGIHANAAPNERAVNRRMRIISMVSSVR